MSNKSPSLKQPSTIIATWFGLGLIPKAPGTWGSLGAIPVAMALVYTLGLWPFVTVLLILTPIGFWATAKYEEQSGIHDNKQIVIDEVIGQWIALFPVFYFYEPQINWVYIILAFALFRFFDITKPWPVSHFDKNVPGAMGVMMDDIVAGVIAACIIIGGVYAGLG